MMRAQTDQSKLALQANELAHDQRSTRTDALVEMNKIAADLHKNKVDNLVKIMHIDSTDRNLAARMQHGQSKKNR
jgi:hypothetical protein